MIKSEPGLGAIAPGETHLASRVQFACSQNKLSAAGDFTTTGGIHYAIDFDLILPDGRWLVQLGKQEDADPEVRAIAFGEVPPANWQLIQILAGFGVGIEVRDGAIAGDVYVLTVVDNPPSD